MPQYTLVLELTNRGKDGHSPTGQERRQKAIQKAIDNHVTGWFDPGQPPHDIQDAPPDITENADGTITWKVQGTQADVCNMVKAWLNPPQHKKANVRVKNDGGLNCP
jgi:hypothetical protein